MLMTPNIQLTISEIDNLFPYQPDESIPGKAEETLHSHMITGFEEAVSLGMAPVEALSHVLLWAASEMARIDSEQRRGAVT